MARVLSRPMADNVGDMLDSDLRATLVDVERLGWDSLCDSTGADFYGKIMTEDAVMVLANGAVMDRSAVVDALRQAPPWRRYDISDARLIEAGPDSVVLVYVGSAYRGGDDPDFVGAMSSVYVRRGDDWRLALYQQTPMPTQSA